MAHKIALEKQLEESQKSGYSNARYFETAKRLMADISASAERRAEPDERCRARGCESCF